MRHVFISPHLDDAVLSAGDFLLKLKKENKKVLIVTVFTKFGKEPISKDSKKYLKYSDFLSLEKFSQARKFEDFQAMKKLEVKFIHLDFVDGGFRKNNGKVIYPNHDKSCLFSGKISNVDENLITKLRKRLSQIIKSDDVLYGPKGIGKHVDHLIVRKVLASFENKQFLWMDQPYVKGIKKKPSKEKLEVIDCYKSQVKCLFKGRVRLKQEKIFKKKPVKIGLISSRGGHFFQLMQLKNWWSNYDRFWTIDKGSDSKSLLKKEKVYYGFFPEHRNILNTVRNTFLAIKLIFKEKPDLLISCGAGIAVPFFYVGKLFGCKLIFIEPYDFIKNSSLTGRLVAPIVDKLLVQQKLQEKFYKNAEYWGSLL